MKDFFKKTAGKVVIIAAVCVCVLVVFLVKTGQDAQSASLAADSAVEEQIKQQAVETSAAATQTPTPALPDRPANAENRPASPSESAQPNDAGQAEPKPSAGAEAQAEETLPIFLEFGADWCPYCEQMKPTIEELKNEYDGRLQFVEINIDEDPETANAFGAYSVPYYVLLDEEGTPTLSFSGATTKEKLQDFIKEGVGIEP